MTMQNKIEHLRTVLNSAIPDIKNGCVIQTAHGDIIVTCHEAEKLGHFVREMYQQRLKIALQIAGCTHCED